MSLPTWIPPFGASVVGSILSWLIAFRVAQAKFESKVTSDITRADELREADEKRATELRAADIQRADELRIAAAKQSEDLRAELREMKGAWSSGIDRVQGLAENIANLQGSQNQINVFQEKALQSLIERSDRHETVLADHTSTLRLLVDRVMSVKAQQ